MAANRDEKISVLFCCLGNICECRLKSVFITQVCCLDDVVHSSSLGRSPLAEAVFADFVKKVGYSSKFENIDSCGTGAYHAGDSPDDRTVAVCRQNGIPITGSARKVRLDDFDKFDWIFGMDSTNVRNLRSMQPKGSKAKVHLFGDFDDKKAIADPYYGADNGFQTSYEQCVRYSRAFLNHLDLDTTRL